MGDKKELGGGKERRGEKRPRGGWGGKQAQGKRTGSIKKEVARLEARAGELALACLLTLMHCDIAAVPVAVDKRVLGPAPLVGAHAAAADHLLHAIGELALQ